MGWQKPKIYSDNDKPVKRESRIFCFCHLNWKKKNGATKKNNAEWIKMKTLRTLFELNCENESIDLLIKCNEGKNSIEQKKWFIIDVSMVKDKGQDQD